MMDDAAMYVKTGGYKTSQETRIKTELKIVHELEDKGRGKFTPSYSNPYYR